jgi:hypothetical protein
MKTSHLEDRVIDRTTIYDLKYFDCDEGAEHSLEIMASKDRPLFLPEHRLLLEISRDLTTKASSRDLDARDVLLAYQKLRENHDHTDVFCGWKTLKGPACGGLMDIEVDASGAFYQCQVDSNHRTPK